MPINKFTIKLCICHELIPFWGTSLKQKNLLTHGSSVKSVNCVRVKL